MKKNSTQDIRVRRTKKLIQTTFQEMIIIMDYNDITIKELADRACINRKTFYLHYDSLDDLLTELQEEIIANVLVVTNHKEPYDFRTTLGILYEQLDSHPQLYQKLLCSGNNHIIIEQITNKLLLSVSKHWFNNPNDSDQIKGMLKLKFIAVSALELYLEWVAIGNSMPLNEFIDFATSLICDGIEGDNKKI